MATAKKTDSGKWRVQVAKMIDEKLIKKSITANTKAEAEYLAEQWKGTVKEEANPINLTFDEAIDRYIENKSNILSPSTIRNYRTIQKNAIELIKDIKIKNISREIVQKQININADKYSYKSCKNQLGLISVVLGQFDISFKISLPPKQKPNYIIPTLDDIPIIIEMIKGSKIELQILFALMLGLRQSEIAALKWENLKGNKIHVIGAIVPDEHHVYVEKKTNKSIASTRTLTVPKYLLDKLNAIKEDSGYIFKTKPNHVHRIWRRLTEKNGLPPFRVHDLRHANASLMLLLNVPDKYAMQRLGQLDPKMIKNIYQHTFDKEMDIIDERLNKFFEDIT